jgi:hypothetical protein
MVLSRAYVKAVQNVPRGDSHLASAAVNAMLARLAKVHAYIIAHLKSQMPTLWGHSKKQREILDNLPDEFTKIAAKHKLPYGDFPDIKRFKEMLASHDLSKMPKLSEKYIQKLDNALMVTIPHLLQQIKINHDNEEVGLSGVELNPFQAASPFETAHGGDITGSGLKTSPPHSSWAISLSEKTTADNLFYGAKLSNGKLKGEGARELFAKWGLGNDVLFRVWKLADIDGSNSLDCDEFAVAMHLMDKAKAGGQLPDKLPVHLVPPSKRL